MLEVGSNRIDLVDHIINKKNSVLAQVLLNDGVVRQRDSLWVAALVHPDLAVTTLVDELANALQVGVSIGDEWLDNLEHLHCGFGEADKDAGVDLKEAEQLERLALLGIDLIDTIVKCESKL